MRKAVTPPPANFFTCRNVIPSFRYPPLSEIDLAQARRDSLPAPAWHLTSKCVFGSKQLYGLAAPSFYGLASAPANGANTEVLSPLPQIFANASPFSPTSPPFATS